MTAREAVEGMLAEHRLELVAFVRRRAGHLVDPDDIVQQAAVRALSKTEQLREPSHARAWLYRIVRNTLSDELRAIGLPVEDDPEELAAPEPEDEAKPCQCALKLAKTLKPEYATILERVVLEEAPVTAIAAELGVTPNNAMVRLHRARKALRTLVEEHCGVSSMRNCLDCVCDERGCCAAS